MHRTRNFDWRVFVFLLVITAGSAAVHAQQVIGCGSLENPYGPFDYRDPWARAQNLPIVEANHFTPEVETLARGKSSANVIDDLNYTLRAFPNHHRALNSVAVYALHGGKISRQSSIPSAECYFKRAIVFRPEDEVVRIIYANFLAKQGQPGNARIQYDEALRLEPASADVNYDAGLFYLSIGNLEKARALAKVAYEGGYPLPGLRDKIKAAESKGTH